MINNLLKIIFAIFISILLLLIIPFSNKSTDNFIGYNSLMKDIIQNKNIDMYLNDFKEVNFQTRNHYTPLMIAIKYNNIVAVNKLIGTGIDVNKATSFGKTPLMFAVINNNFHIVKLLIKNGAKINIQDSLWHYDSLMLAIKMMQGSNSENCFEIVSYLINKGANLNNIDFEGNTAIFHCAYDLYSAEKQRVLELLLKSGSRKNHINFIGESAYDIAKGTGAEKEILHLLDFDRSLNE